MLTISATIASVVIAHHAAGYDLLGKNANSSRLTMVTTKYTLVFVSCDANQTNPKKEVRANQTDAPLAKTMITFRRKLTSGIVTAV